MSKKVSSKTPTIKASIYAPMELSYLKLHASGHSNSFISEFLGYDYQAMQDLRERIAHTARTRCLVTVLMNALDADILKKTDYVNPLVHQVCLEFTAIIFKKNFELSFIRLGKVQAFCLLNEFYSKCVAVVMQEYVNKEIEQKFSDLECSILSLTIQSIHLNGNLAARNNVLTGVPDNFELHMGEKSDTHGLFSILKKASEYRVLDAFDLDEKCVQGEIGKMVHELLTFSKKDIDVKEENQHKWILAHINNKLLLLYARIEFLRLKKVMASTSTKGQVA